MLYGHCFETNSKKGKVPNGIDTNYEMKKELKIPVYAIGGITTNYELKSFKQVKADGIAVMSGIFSAKIHRQSA